jgi:hypothetical protein
MAPLPHRHLPFAAVLLWLLATCRCALAADPQPKPSDEFFERRIRPVLVEHCLKCHGGDPQKIKGGFRVDSGAALVRGGDSGPALVPGDPAKSRLIEAVTYKNVDLQMPPKGRLSDAVIADLTAWVKDGAPWPEERSSSATARSEFDLARRKAEHWAWRPVRRPQVPAVKDDSWPAGAVDRFILAKLEDKGLSPAPKADRRTLLRRVYFDLIGLPPSPEETDRFANDDSSDAYARVVDRLLASPAFGERWARHWLDLVRYADTRGHEFDHPIPNAWQYRDYVIRALNADVPYDQFVREHVAGDLLDRPRRHSSEVFNESILGTGFWLLGEEVHSPVDVRQDLGDRLDNRIDVLTKTFLGLTVSCARCHDHKFDAISSRDYYALFGILEGAGPRSVRFDSLEQNQRVASDLARVRAESAGAIRTALAADATPVVSQMAKYLLAAREVVLRLPSSSDDGMAHRLADPEIDTALHAAVSDVAGSRKLDAGILGGWVAAMHVAANDPADPLFAWARVASEARATEPARFSEVLRSARERVLQVAPREPFVDDRKEVVLDFARCGPAEWHPDEGTFGPGPDLPGAVRLPPDSREVVQFAEEGAAVYDHTLDGLLFAPGSEKESGALGRHLRAGRTIVTPPFVLTTGKLFYRVRGTGSAYAAVEGHSLIAGPLHAQFILDFKADDGFRWVLHDLTPYKGRRLRVEFTAQSGQELAIAQVIQSDRDPRQFKVVPRGLLTLLASQKADSLETLAAGYEKLFQDLVSVPDGAPEMACDAAGRAHLANWLLARPALFSGNARRDATDKALAALAQVAAGFRKDSRLGLALLDSGSVDERVFVRGSYKVLGEAAPRRFLEALAGSEAFARGPSSGRLELARQMTDPERNPLLARVIVNRLWHHLFGRGIVASTDNFGVLGERPTHPELLDYLADEFVRRGWSIKAMVRMLVLSNSYRMDSRADAAADGADPQDLLVHRMRLRRLEGEAIRDTMLAVSGRLDSRQFGPAVPVHLTEFLDGRGRPAKGGPLDGEGRRSLYLAVRRNFLSPFLTAFDTPTPFSTVGRRNVSNVPAQALILLNDPFVHEQAATWAGRVLAKPGTAKERVGGMYRQAFGRPPDDDESRLCLSFLARQCAMHGVDEAAPQPWTDLAHTLFNAKEFVYVR